MTSTEKLTSADRVFGEIYEANGIYWAEVISTEDGFDKVVEQSTDFADREQAIAWLAARDLAVAKTFDEVVVSAVEKFAQAAFWTRLRGAFASTGKLAGAN